MKSAARNFINEETFKMERKKIQKTLLLVGVALLGVSFLCAPSWAGPPRTLQGVPVPTPPNLASFVANTTAAIQLGKAFFWDMQVGSDGIQACASCHFQAGADVRFKNQMDPGLRANPSDNTFQTGGPNLMLKTTNFPIATNEIVGSQGFFNANFVGVVPGNPVETCTTVADPNGFQVGGINTRRVTARNTPPAVNAVHNFNNFWDGRGKNIFNGNNPAGPGFEDYLPYSNDPTLGLIQVPLVIPNASAASQATGPPRADEMSCAGRTWPDIGRKMLSLATPLAKQKVSPTDSVLGALAAPAKGLTTTYQALIQTAFVSTWWNSATPVTIGTNTYTQMEANFPLFWGLAIQLYEATLISDQTPFDKFDAGNPAALNAQQQRGLNIFNGKAGCAGCHGGYLLSDASDPSTSKQFDNVGVRPVLEDIGAGAVFGSGFNGMFKIPGLRNIELTGPYFHNGGKATLDQVIDFYDRGGDFANPGINSLGLSAQEKADLKAFLLALTDERVRQESSPFDHPELLIPNGHPGDNEALTCINGIDGCESFLTLAAVGAGGRLAEGLLPLQPFMDGAKYTVAGDFDKDGKSDITIWRPGDGNWYTIRSSDGGVITRQWGAPNDIPVTGDYDGDGKPDLAVWRPSDGKWYILRSSDGTVTETQWGTGTLFANSDVPVPGDYDGDGKADIAVWRPNDGTWYIKRSSDGLVTTTQWGTLNDITAPGDYDGDGKADLAVFRPADGTWYIKRSSDGLVVSRPFGTTGDVPVAADYDGDGKADIAVYRPSNGDWYIINSSTGLATETQWGAPGDIALVGDFDGDGKADFGCWRPGDGNWYVLRSSDRGVMQAQWGSGPLLDEPII